MASTYENDLRLEEMATGENSGSWGTKTNTNLELIADAFGYGTEAITTNADTHTTTIADGTSDAGRAIYLKYTGALDSACTITIGPNTVSKMWFIENATSGSQNIIISQGSGANITIGAGKTKIVYSDGAGAGAAFVEATDGISINSLFLEGNATFGDNNKAIFGAGSDLQIYHDGTHSYISDVGTGPLRITSDGTGILLNKSTTESMGRFLTDGAVELYYDNAKKFETTSTGVDIKFDGGGSQMGLDIHNQGTATGDDAALTFETQGSRNFTMGIDRSALSFVIAESSTLTTNPRLVIDDSGNVGIGTDSPTVLLDLESASPTIRLTDSDASGTPECQISGAGGDLIFDADRDNEKGSSLISFKVDGSERMRIDSSGNVGINTTAPSPVGLGIVTGGGSKGVMLTRNGSSGNPTSGQGFGSFGFKGLMDGSNSMAAAEASIEAIASENHSGSTAGTDLAFYTKPSGTGPGSGPTERFRITAAGNVGINTSSPSVPLTVEANSGGNNIRLLGRSSDGFAFLGFRNNNDNSDNAQIGASNGAEMLFYTNGSNERMRISSDGTVFIGKTSTGNAAGIQLNQSGSAYFVRDSSAVLLVNRLGSDGVVVQFYNDSSGVGSISVSGSTTAYNTSSDYRLKENVVALTGASARVNQLDVKRFNFIDDDTNTLVDGFLAHEVADVVPEAITGAKDAMKDEEYEVSAAIGEIYTPLEAAYVDDDGNEVAATDEVIHSTDVVEPETLAEGQLWRETTKAVMGTRSVPDMQGIDQSKLVPLLTAALQEALTEIAALKARVTTLEG